MSQLPHTLAVHLLYATIVWIAASLVTSIRSASPTLKYWIWVATSVYFVLPLNALPDRLWPAPVSWFTPANAAARWIDRLTFGTSATLYVVWIAGIVVMLARLAVRSRATMRSRGPAVEGFFRTKIRVPEDIERNLTERELDAVLIHEDTHARRRDNLIGLVYELSVCALWFHPLVWITGSRLALYRELSCDEPVARHGRGGDLISALAKLAHSDDTLVLQSGASSFIERRLAHLTMRERGSAVVQLLLAASFAAVLTAAVIGPVAQSAAALYCARTHGVQR